MNQTRLLHPSSFILHPSPAGGSAGHGTPHESISERIQHHAHPPHHPARARSRAVGEGEGGYNEDHEYFGELANI
jgi:hypothetical protein